MRFFSLNAAFLVIQFRMFCIFFYCACFNRLQKVRSRFCRYFFKHLLHDNFIIRMYLFKSYLVGNECRALEYSYYLHKSNNWDIRVYIVISGLIRLHCIDVQLQILCLARNRTTMLYFFKIYSLFLNILGFFFLLCPYLT